MYTIHKLTFDSILDVQRNPELRYGQAIFNNLMKNRPDLSERIRGGPMDIFFLRGPADDPERWDAFFTFITKHWLGEQ